MQMKYGAWRELVFKTPSGLGKPHRNLTIPTGP